MRLFWCTIDPQINHEARINHAKHELIELEIELEWLKTPYDAVGIPVAVLA